MSDWHGYPQIDGAHPERPWWRRVASDPLRTRWVRIDGLTQPDEYGEPKVSGLLRIREYTGPTLEALDREHPLPAPPPKVGQVWVFTYRHGKIVEEWEKTVATVKRTCGLVERVWFTDSYGPVGKSLTLAEWCHDDEAVGGVPDGRNPALVAVAGAWPPAGAVLVAGPHSPWSTP